MSDKTFNEARGLQFVEIHMPKMDAPRLLANTHQRLLEQQKKA